MSIQAPSFIGTFWGGVRAPLLAPGLSGGLMFEQEGFAPIGYDRDNLWDGNEWPCSRFIGNGVDVDGQIFTPAGWGNRLLWPSGNSSFPYWLNLICKDESGNPLGAVSLRVFDSATEALLYELEFDGVRDSPTNSVDGSARIGLPNNTVDYYVVAYRYGPDKAGSTIRTLRGS